MNYTAQQPLSFQMKNGSALVHAESSPLGVLPIHDGGDNLVGVVRAAGEYRLIALKKINAGARMFHIEGELADRPTRYSVQIGRDLHIDLNPGHSPEEILDRYFWRFMNHSCDPNSMISERAVIALKVISPWEDVTFDYNATEYDMADPFPCRCGSARCLGAIRGFKHLTLAQRQRLRPHLASHLLDEAEVIAHSVPSMVTA